MTQLIPHSLCHSYHRKTMFKPPLYLSIVVVEQHVSSGTSRLHTVPLKNQHFITDVKRFTAAAQGQEIQTEKERDGKKERKEGGSKGGRKERRKIHQLFKCHHQRDPIIQESLLVCLSFDGNIPDSLLALPDFTPFRTDPLRSTTKEIFSLISVHRSCGPRYPYCKQIAPTWHHRVTGCSSLFTKEATIEGRR